MNVSVDICFCWQMKDSHLVIRALTLSNPATLSLQFRLVSDSPFDIAQVDQKSGRVMQRTNRTDLLTLEPRQNAVVHIAFCLTPNMLNQQMLGCEDGSQLPSTGPEKRLQFQQVVSYHSSKFNCLLYDCLHYLQANGNGCQPDFCVVTLND